PQINHDRGKVFVRHVTEWLVWHQRGEGAPVVSNAFANRSRQLVVGPGSGTGFWICGQGRGYDTAGKVGRIDPLSCAFRAGKYWGSVGFPVMLGVAFHTAGQSHCQIASSRQALWGRLELSRSEGARFRTDKRPPSDGQRDSNDKEEYDHDRGI